MRNVQCANRDNAETPLLFLTGTELGTSIYTALENIQTQSRLRVRMSHSVDNDADDRSLFDRT